MTDSEMFRGFIAYIATVMLEASQKGNSLAMLEFDPKEIHRMPVSENPSAGTLVVAIACGPSIQPLKNAVQLVQHAH